MWLLTLRQICNDGMICKICKICNDGIKVIFSIFDCLRSKKKSILTITVFKTTGKITIQGSAHKKWKDIEYQNIQNISDGAMESDKDIENFAQAIRLQPAKDQQKGLVAPLPSEIDLQKIPLPDDDDSASDIVESLLLRIEAIENENKAIQLKQQVNTNSICKLENENISLKNKVRKLEAEKKSWDNMVVTEKDNILREILHLDKKLANTKLALSKLENDHRNLNENYLNLLQKFNDNETREKTGEKRSQQLIASVEADSTKTSETVMELKNSLDSLRKSTTDKIKHLSQEVNQIHQLSAATKNNSVKSSKAPSKTEQQETASSMKQTTSSDAGQSLEDKTETPETAEPSNASEIDIGESKVLIVGDSIIKGIKVSRFDKSRQTFVKVKKGGTIDDIAKISHSIKASNLKIIVIHAGTNDLLKLRSETIVTKLNSLACEMMSKFPSVNVYVSTIIYRESRNGKNNFELKIDEINRELENIANTNHYKVINNENISDPAYRYDGLHLNNDGTAQLVKNIKSNILNRYRQNKPERKASDRYNKSENRFTKNDGDNLSKRSNIEEKNATVTGQPYFHKLNMSTPYGPPYYWPYPSMPHPFHFQPPHFFPFPQGR